MRINEFELKPRKGDGVERNKEYGAILELTNLVREHSQKINKRDDDTE